jgi:predicted N-acetyltransferase YhbS
MSPTSFRRSYSDDPTLADRIFALLETWFTGIGAMRREAAQLGSLWEECSTPFVYEKDGQVISHVGLLQMPYVIKGERHRLGGVHAVCTLESERRRGHFRRIMEELLEFCDGRFETLELCTENPEYYEPFGFRIVPEQRFVAKVAWAGGNDGLRAFDPTRIGEIGRLDRLLTERVPVSELVGVFDERDVFKFSQGGDGLYYSEALDCFAAFEVSGSRLRLFDVVARELPSLDALLSQLTPSVRTVEFHFSPDRFDVNARPEPFRSDCDYYMVRGPFAAEGEAFMVPPSARH